MSDEARKDDVANDEAEKSGTRSTIILAGVALVVAIYGITFGLQTLEWYDAHRCAGINPWLNDVPKVLTVSNMAAAPVAAAPTPIPVKGKAGAAKATIALPNTTALTSYNIEFTVPWGGKFTQKPTPVGDLIRFDSGQVIVFTDPDAQIDTLLTIRQSTDAAYAPFRNLIEAENISTNYGLYQAVYGVAPSQTSPFMPYAQAERARVLLLTKLSFGFDLERDVFSFTLGRNKGFQFGDPAKGPVALRIFSEHDEQYRMLMGVAYGTAAQITQDQVNQTVQSLGRAAYTR